MTKKTNSNVKEIAELVIATTGGMMLAAPVIDAHPIGGGIFAAIIVVAIIGLCWISKGKE
jgi:hypothetical protein